MLQPKNEFNAVINLLEGNLNQAETAELASEYDAVWQQVIHRGRALRELTQQLDDPELIERFNSVQRRAAAVKQRAASFIFPEPCQSCAVPVYPSNLGDCPQCGNAILILTCGDCRDNAATPTHCASCS